MLFERVLPLIYFVVATAAFTYILIFRKGKDEGLLDDLRGGYLIGTCGVAVMSLIFPVTSFVE